MTDSIVIEADYADFVFKRGLKSARISFDIPIEKGAWFIEKFGAPDPGNPVKVAIARLQIGPDTKPASATSPDISGPPHTEAPQGQGKEPRPFSTLPRSQQAGIRCGDTDFHGFLFYKYPLLWDGQTKGPPDGVTLLVKDVAERVVESICDTDSLKNLNAPPYAENWDRLLREYGQWSTEKRYGDLRR